MKLTYRGVSYDYNPPVVETTDGETGGKYRGLDWRFRNLKKPFVLQPTVNLTYRGVAYNKASTVETVFDGKSATSIQEKARLSVFNQEKETRKRHQNVLTRLATDIGL
ncbi:DUF4278 domain-containing protein [Chroococcus sp. FPU101]|uniref:DUF4278 domain-containing protein n=1 Tax=Chroococcus sp. FPU101 TaxID=1974212 RepID=UPI001A8DC9D0|nr:DUF4278 domain-containing protein [Chroococcus sp. FPU101]GFE67915.1 hypothetical protein CFPU101_05250 [Chroococcus sp. FPU101]